MNIYGIGARVFDTINAARGNNCIIGDTMG